ncbi:MAG TPA: cytochrome c oxidase subunit II [Gemmatimonadales bacterium]|nr:cytochrome c oxidase subunit II [Gemmatimonadales bacterium]
MIGVSLAHFLLQQSHSALNPSSPQSRLIDRLWDAMYLTSVVVFVLVVSALLWGAFRPRRADESPVVEPGRERRLTLAVTIATGLTAVILFGFLVFDMAVGRQLTKNPGNEALQIRVTGHQWWWEVQYRDSSPQNWVTTANEIHVPVGRPVVFELRSTDVIHSFWPPSLSPKRDLIPGDVNSLWFQADTPGVYRGQCLEYCGLQHAKMGFLVIAETPADFATWVARQRDTAKTPADSVTRRGQEVFLASSCVMCHAISGTPAASRIGPDLTHLASRKTLAAGTLPNTRGNLAGWILNPQAIKPGTRMPPNQFNPDDLHALLTYLESLQ